MKRLSPEQLREIAISKGSPTPMMLKYNITKAYVYRIRRTFVDKIPSKVI